MIEIDPRKDILVVFGPTGSGKSTLAVDLALQLNGIVINADSSQVYKEAPILSNIPTLEEQQNMVHKLFSICNVGDSFSVVSWLQLVEKEVEFTRSKGLVPIICGGTGMYISSLLYGITDIPSSSEYKNKGIKLLEEMGYERFKNLMTSIDPLFVKRSSDPQRLIRAYEVFYSSGKTLSAWQMEQRRRNIRANFINIYLQRSRTELYHNIDKRLELMVEKGVLNEVENLIKMGSQYLNKFIGAKEFATYIIGKSNLSTSIELAQQKTRNYAKRQITWFNNQIKNCLRVDNNLIVKNRFKV